MFGEGNYLLAIPLPKAISDKMQKLIVEIAAREPEYGLSKELTKKISVRGEFHITLGVFHPHTFETNRGLFKHILRFLNTHKQTYAELKDSFKGKCTIKGIGYEQNHLKDSDIVYATVESSEANAIRSKIHNLLQFSEIDEKHFQFTDPHITLFTKAGKKDQHGIPKPLKLPLHNFLKDGGISFDFKNVSFYKGPKIILAFGDKGLDGKPDKSFSKFLKAVVAEAKKKEAKKEPNWGNLFKKFDRDDALKIKKAYTEDGMAGIAKAGFAGKQMGEIRNLLEL